MELVWATEGFLIAGQSYKGFPILLWDTMESCAPANQFFRKHLLRGGIRSRRSWPSVGRALYDFFSFLQAHDLDWHDVDRGEAKCLTAAYRDYCLITHKLSLSTTRQRLHYIFKFYEYAHKSGWVTRLPFSYEERPRKGLEGFLAHLDGSGGKAMVNDVMPRMPKVFPKYLSLGEVKALLASVENLHHRMMIRLALCTGLRREEIATFPVAYVINPDKPECSERNLRIRLNPYDGSGMATKGSKPREIHVTRLLMAELYNYVQLGGVLIQASHMTADTRDNIDW